MGPRLRGTRFLSRSFLAAAFLLSASAAGATPELPGSWRVLAPAPIAVDDGLSAAWTGEQLLVFGRLTNASERGTLENAVDVAAAYDPSADRWRRVTPPARVKGYFPGHVHAFWTGKELVVWGPVDEAYDPSTNRWHRLAKPPAGEFGYDALAAWTGREVIGFGGGCCGDAFSNSLAYDPAADRWRRLPRSPLAGSQQPLGAWDGRELLVYVGNLDPDGKPWPARLARAAAYDPRANRWRRIAPLPAPRTGASAIWDGKELLVVGGWQPGPPAATAATGFAYDPATNRWRRLPRMESGRIGAAAVWTGKHLLVWGGATQPPGATAPNLPTHGLAYDPRANRWTPLPQAPIWGRADPAAVWTGKAMLVWGGPRYNHPPFADGAAFTPAAPQGRKRS